MTWVKLNKNENKNTKNMQKTMLPESGTYTG